MIADRKFDTCGTRISYSVGQPMGMLSSWAAFALTHHYVIQLCAIKAHGSLGSSRFTEYAVLGDDVAIWDSEVAECYLRLMNYLGVKISSDKTIIGVGVAEFAKVLFVKGQYFKPISPSLLAST